MELHTLWFILVVVLFTGFFILEGFDFGVGILSPWLGKTEAERRTILRTIGPHWDGNEVWLLTAGGAIFAAFPKWYATMFSALYLPLLLVLVALILRGLAIEYRNKLDSVKWRSRWDLCIFIGSLLAALLMGVAITDLVHGIPIDQNGVFQGNFLDLVKPFPLVGGLASLVVFVWIGILFLQLKLEGHLLHRTQHLIRKVRWIVVAVFALLGVVGFSTSPYLAHAALPVKAIAVLAAIAMVLSAQFSTRKAGIAFVCTVLGIALTSVSAFGALFPNTMVSSLDTAFNLTTLNSSSTPYTLKVMSFVALLFVPVVLVYQGWTYWVFRARVKHTDRGGY